MDGGDPAQEKRRGAALGQGWPMKSGRVVVSVCARAWDRGGAAGVALCRLSRDSAPPGGAVPAFLREGDCYGKASQRRCASRVWSIASPRLVGFDSQIMR